jgi:hypothetical protein
LVLLCDVVWCVGVVAELWVCLLVGGAGSIEVFWIMESWGVVSE